MRRLTAALLAVVGGILLLAATPVQADVPNGGFEQGNLSGWLTDIPVNGSITLVTRCDFGSADVGGCPSGFAPYTPVEGNFFARVKTDGPSSYTTLARDFDLLQGDVLNGDFFFADGEQTGDVLSFCDTGDVLILANGRLEDGGTVIESIFHVNICDILDNDDSTPWTPFSYRAPVPMRVTLELRLTNEGDATHDSVMGLDNVWVQGRHPDVGGGGAVGGIIAAITQGVAASNPPPPAAPIVPPSTGVPFILPPNTGDGGLAHHGAGTPLPALAVLAVGLAGTALAVRRLSLRAG